jgi:hypothetical protein
MARGRNFFQKDRGMNMLIVCLLATQFALYVGNVVTKWNEIDGNETEEDAQCDFMKLFMVWINILTLAILLFFKKVMTNGSCGIITFYSLSLLGLNIAVIINVGIVINIFVKGEHKGEHGVSFLSYNYDFLTLGITLYTNLCYLIFYFAFRAKRAGLITLVLIFVSCIVFAACAQLGDDFAVDTANATVSLITAMISMILWSGEVKINDEGGAVEFHDFFDRDDLEDMQVMISNQVQATDKNTNRA